MTELDQKSASMMTSGSPNAETFCRLNEQVKFGHQAWIERLREMQAVEVEFTTKLLATRDPAQVLKVCNRWIAKRLELLAADSRDFAGFWMDLVLTVAGSDQPAHSQLTKDKEP